MYSFDGRIRYSETDPEGKLKIESLIDYFQDCCSFQSEDGGVGVTYTKEHRCAWMVNFWQIDILRRPRLGEWVRTTTIPYEFKAFMGFRNCVMETLPGEGAGEESAAGVCQNGKDSDRPGEASLSAQKNMERTLTAQPSTPAQASRRVAISNSVWSLIDLDKGLPVRVKPEMYQAYPLDSKLDMEYLPRKIRLPQPSQGAALREADPIPVTSTMIDSNGHVNNGQYVRLALSLGPDEDRIRRLCVEYVRQARPGDVILPRIYDDPLHTIALCSQADGKPFAVVQLS